MSMKRRLAFIGVWALSSLMLAIVSLYVLVFTNGYPCWFVVPLLGIGLPSAGLLLALLGLLPGTGRQVKIFVRVLPPGESALKSVEAVRIKSRLYRIISPHPDEPLEFSAGDIVECAEQELPDGQKGLIAVFRT